MEIQHGEETKRGGCDSGSVYGSDRWYDHASAGRSIRSQPTCKSEKPESQQRWVQQLENKLEESKAGKRLSDLPCDEKKREI